MAKKKWIQGAINKPGSLTAAAKRKKQSINQFCASANLSSTNKRRCALAKTLAKMRKKK